MDNEMIMSCANWSKIYSAYEITKEKEPSAALIKLRMR
jgi:hypothetical protein